MKDKLLTLIVMVGALVAYWVVLFQQYRKRPRLGSRRYDSAGGSDAGSEGGWFGGHGHSGDHGGGDAGGSDGGGGDGGGGGGGGGSGD